MSDIKHAAALARQATRHEKRAADLEAQAAAVARAEIERPPGADAGAAHRHDPSRSSGDRNSH